MENNIPQRILKGRSLISTTLYRGLLFLLRKKTLILSGVLITAQFLSPLGVIITYAAPTTSNDAGSGVSLDPISNKATRLQTQGSSGVDQSSGALTYSYPISIPEGRNGMSPKLALSYNSQNSDSGWFGYGWMLSIPYIERTTKMGSNKLYSNPAFVSSLHGELISNNGVAFEQKVDDGSFAKYSFVGNSWQMTDRDGTIYYFGNSSSSRIEDATSTKIGRWYITEARDKFGNGIRYNYTKDNNTVYPDTISYTEHALAHPLNLITFNLENKNDKTISYKYGFKTTDTKRVVYMKVASSGSDNAYYTFNYTIGTNGVRSLLQTIEEKHLGTNGDWALLPKTTFEYEKSSISLSGSVSGSVDPYGSNSVIDTGSDGILDLYNAGTGYFPIDINGDYKKDLMQSDITYGVYSSGLYINFKYNQGGSFASRSLVAPTSQYSYVRSMLSGMPTPPLRYMGEGNWWWTQESTIADINGDGFDDVLYSDPYAGNGVAINTTNNTFDYSTSSSLAISVLSDQLADVNSDGLLDKIVKSYTSTSTLFSVYLNTGSGYSSTSDFAYDAKIASTTSSLYDIGIRFSDVNNDGLVDAIHSYTSAYSPTGNPSCTTAYTTPSATPLNQSVNEIAINTGTGFLTSSSTLSGYLISYSSCADGSGNPHLVTKNVKEYDTNGNLTTDYDGLTNNTLKQDILKKVTGSLGSTMDVSYVWSTATGLNTSLPIPMYIVATTTDKLSSSDSNPHAVGYSFYGGQMYFDATNPRDHKFAGFFHVDVIDGKNKTVTYYHQGNGDDYTTGEKNDSYYNIGRAYRTDTFDLSSGSPVLSSKNLSLYTTYSYASSSFTYLDSQVLDTFNSDNTFLSSGNKNVYDETKRLIKTSYAYGDIEPFTSFASSTLSDKGTDIITTKYEYSNTRPQRLIKQLSTDFAETIISNQSYYYDNLPYGLVDKGAVTKVADIVYKSDNTVSSTSSAQTVYDATGNVIQTIDNLNRKINITYDSTYFFPVTKVDALNGTTTFSYDNKTLNLLTSKGPDGITYVKETDGFGKVTRSYTLNYYGGVVDETKINYVYGNGLYIFSNKLNISGASAKSFQAYDSYGRLIQSKVEASPDIFSSQDTNYDASSNITSISLPYSSSGYGLTTDTPSNGSTVYTYDGLGRVITKSSFGNTVTYSYGARNLLVSDNASTLHKKQYTYDANGNISQVKEYNGSDIYSTNYNYTPTGKLSRITDANGNIRNFSYLSNGSLVYQEDSHIPSDTTYTSYTYSYDTLNNLISKAGPLGTTTYAYDSLNRPTSRVLADTAYGSSTVSITYTGCSNNYTAPCVITRSTSSTTLAYEASGKLQSETLSIDGKTFARSYLYDAFGNPTTVTYPDNGKAVYTYTLDGKQSTLSYVTPSGSTKNIVSASTYNSLNALSSVTFGNGIRLCNTYSNQSADGVISPKLSKSTYLFNSNGCALSVSNQVELYKDEFTYKDNLTPSNILSTYKDIAGTTYTKSDSLTYDNLARLTKVSTSYNGGTAIDDTLVYDPIGNILKENDILYRYSPDGMQNPNAVTTIGGTHITYDSQGNRIQSGDSAYSWNALNQMVSASSTNGTETYTYDENGERIKKVVQATSVINQTITPSVATATASTFIQGDLLSLPTASSTIYIATSTYNTLTSLALLDKTTLYTLVSNYYGSPFTSKFCIGVSSAVRQSCIASTTKQLIANDINARSTSTTATNGLVTDIIKIANETYLIPTSYTGIATSSIATSDTETFTVDSSTITSYNTYISTGIVVPMAQYSNLPYVSSSTYTTLETLGITDTSKLNALLTLSGCDSTTSACTTALKVVFEKFYKENSTLLSDKALQEMWYVYAFKARLPGNSTEFTATSTTLGNITVPTITGRSTSAATTTYYSTLYFNSEYNNQNATELRLQFFNTIPYLVTQSVFTELDQAGITQTTLDNYQSRIGDILNIQVSSSTEYINALNEFIRYDKKITLSYTTLKELYLVALGAAIVPNNINEYTELAIFDLAPYLSVNTAYGASQTVLANTTSGCYTGPYSGGYARCMVRTSTFTLPMSTSTVVTYKLSVTAPNPTEWSLVPGESSNPRGYLDTTNSASWLALIYSSYYSTAGTISNDGFTQTIDVTPTVEKQKASSTIAAVMLIMNQSEWVTGTQHAYQSLTTSLKAYANTPRLTLASTSLVSTITSGLTTIVSVENNISTSTLLAYYKLDGNSNDSATSTHNGTDTSITYSAGNGKITSGAGFNSTSDKVNIPYNDFDFQRTQAFSISAWVKLSSVGTNQMIVSHQDNGVNNYEGYALYHGTGGILQFDFYNNAYTPNGIALKTATGTLTSGTWHFVTLTYDGSSSATGTHIYVDNIDKPLTTVFNNLTSSTLNTNSLLIGNRGSSFDFNGAIDEVAIWTSALSSSTVASFYNNSLGMQYPFGNGSSTIEYLATSTYTSGIQTTISNYFGEIYDSSDSIITGSTTASSSLVFISKETNTEFASTTLVSPYSVSKIFLATTTPQCTTSASTTQCDKLARQSLFKELVGNYSGFIPSDAATEEFWLVHKGLLQIPYSVASASTIYATSTHTIFINDATTTVSVLLRSQLSATIATSTATTTINLSAIPPGLLTDLQFNSTYSTSTYALATSTKIVSEDTYNELLRTPLRFTSDVDTVFSYALPYATSTCSGQSATSSCVISAQKTKVKDTISALSGFVLSDAALVELYKVNQRDLYIVPMSLDKAVGSSSVQTIVLPLETAYSLITHSTSTVGATSTISTTPGACSFGVLGATTSLCSIYLPYINSSVTNLSLSFDVSTSTISTTTLTSYLSYITQNATSTGATSTPTFTTTTSTSTITGQKSNLKFTFNITSLYQSFLDSFSPQLIFIPDANGTSSSQYSISNPILTVTRVVTVPVISYSELGSIIDVTATTSAAIVATSSVVAYYKLDGNSNDATAGSHNGTDTSVTYSSGNGKVNNGAGFDATGDKISITYNDFNFQRTQPFTLSAWVKFTSIGTNQMIISHQDNGANNYEGYALYQGSGGTINFDFYSNAYTPNGIGVKTALSTVASGVWYHIVLTYDGSSSVSGTHIYVNNTDKTLTTVFNTLSASTLNTNAFLIGNRGTSFNLNAAVDEVGVWTTALTATDIGYLYNSTAGLQYPFLASSTVMTQQFTYGVSTALPVPFDRSTIATTSVVTATTTIDLTSVPNLDFSTRFLSPVGKITSIGSTTTATTTIYGGDILDTTYTPFPTAPQSILPSISYPYLLASATTTIATSTIYLGTIATSTTSTIYTPFSNYVSGSSTVTTYLTLNGTLVGAYTYQVGNEAASGKISYFLTSYLGTPVLSTDDNGDIVEMDITDVFGNYVHRDQRVDNAFHTKSYTGHEFDDITSNIYAKARYLSAPMHSFLSVDPVIYDLPQSYLNDPQQMNSYAYARNNPIVYKDPNGKWIESGLDIASLAYDVNELNEARENGTASWKNYAYIAGDGIGLALPGLTGVGMMMRMSGKAFEAGNNVQKVASAADKTNSFMSAAVKANETKLLPAAKDIMVGNAKVIFKNDTISLSGHAVEQMAERKITVQQVERVMKNNVPFNYVKSDPTHGSTNMLGYYGKAVNLFVAQIKSTSVVRTVFSPKNPVNYFKNLLNK